MSKRIVIVGGVAGGASAAARFRRLDEAASITIIERGPHVSFANCGLPYFVGGRIGGVDDLLVADPELFAKRFRIEARVLHEVISLDREHHEIEVRELATGRVYREPYDKLILAPGASPIRPAMPGIDLPGVFTIRSIPDSEAVRAFVAAKSSPGSELSALVVGGGFIGLEMTENLVHRGLSVEILELADQVLPPMDPEMAGLVGRRFEENGVRIRLGEALAAIEVANSRQTKGLDGSLVALTRAGERIPADLVILALGVRPESGLAARAGLAIGERGGIVVDAEMRTSDLDIYAVGDVVETTSFPSGERIQVPLAGPANRQGRIAADSIAGRPRLFRGVQGSAVLGAFGLTAALTGASEKALIRAGRSGYRAVALHPPQHAEYYPGAHPIHLKLLFDEASGQILGAQAVGEEGAVKRIDVISMAIQLGGTVEDLEEAELCYAPQFGSAKDPVNLAGMLAANSRRGLVDFQPWSELGKDGALVLDVRGEAEIGKNGGPAGARVIRLEALRGNLDQLPHDRPIQIVCASGKRAYVAARILAQSGFRASVLNGGWESGREVASASDGA